MKTVGAIFEKMKIFNFFLCELPLIWVDRKWKEQAEDNYKRTPDIEFERDWAVGLGAILADGQKIITIFLDSEIFREKPIVSYCSSSNVL